MRLKAKKREALGPGNLYLQEFLILEKIFKVIFFNVSRLFKNIVNHILR